MPELTHKDVLMQPVLTLYLVELFIETVRTRPGLAWGICQPTFRLNPGNLKEHCVIFGDLGNHKSNQYTAGIQTGTRIYHSIGVLLVKTSKFIAKLGGQEKQMQTYYKIEKTFILIFMSVHFFFLHYILTVLPLNKNRWYH